MVKKTLTGIAFTFAVGALSFLAGARTTFDQNKVTAITSTTPMTSLSEYPFINPSVVQNLGKHYIINFIPLKKIFSDTRDRYSQKTYVYFAYLNNDAWIGFDERKMFSAASTIKVPLAMAVMKSVEEGRLQLTDSYTLATDDLDENFGNLYRKGAGAVMSIEELLALMLQESDNTAMNALVHVLRDLGFDDPLANIYAFMGWEPREDFGQAPTYFDINLKTLSNMFIALYNAKYVNMAHSQELLSHLDNSIFDEAIVAGVPSHVRAAHKTGVQDTKLTYSDCGIVYIPQRTYLLCLGSEGASKEQADRFMTEISKATYEYVINH